MKSVNGEQTDRLLAIDSLRGICALLVALHHFKSNGIWSSVDFIKNSFLFVDFFFVLSGFVIARRYVTEFIKGHRITEFMIQRFWRLYPLHFFVLLFWIAFEFVQQIYFAQIRTPFEGPTSLEGLGFNLLLLNAMGLTDGLTWNYPSWSIGAEFWTYLAFAIAAAALKKTSTIALVTAFVSSTVVLATFSPDYIDATSDFGLVRSLGGFSIGALVWIICRAQTENPKGIRKLFHIVNISDFMHRRTIGTFAETIIILSVIVFVSVANHQPYNLASPLLFSVAVIVFACQAGIISELLSRKWFVYLGTISYSIYMFHGFIASRLFSGGLQFAERTTGTILHSPNGLIGSTPVVAAGLTILYLAVVIAAAAFLFAFVETPFRNFGRRQLHRRKSVTKRVKYPAL